MAASAWGDRLDTLAAAIFGGERGTQRVSPLLQAWDRVVGKPPSDGDEWELLHAIRADWALCDAPADPDRGPDSWLDRFVSGSIDELAFELSPTEDDRKLAASVSGIFELWPGRPAMIRDCLRGLTFELASDALPNSTTSGTAVVALWELRVVMTRDGAEPCRAPLEYPPELASSIEEAHRHRRWPGQPVLGLEDLRVLRQRWVHSDGRLPLPRLFDAQLRERLKKRESV